MMMQGCLPNVVTYTAMLDVLCKNFMFDQAHGLLEDMVMEKCSPNTVTFNTVIKGLCSGGRTAG